MIHINLVKNYEVTTKDVNLTEKTFSLDVRSLHGKITRTRSKLVVNNSIEIPAELLEVHYNIILSIDRLTINSTDFLISIS